MGDGDREVMVEQGDGSVAQVDFERTKWVDVPQKVAFNLNEQDGFELESVKKAAKTRAAKVEE